MIVLVHHSPTSLERDHGRHPNLGVLSCPARTYLNVEGWTWAADNRAYSGWDENAYRRMLERITDIPNCLFVTAPDIVADHDGTLALFYDWENELRYLPIAFVGQDGQLGINVPWDSITTLFLGGTSQWKMGDSARKLAQEAKRRGKWLHMGRVNTRQRLVYAKAIGCDSIDGTAFSMYRKTHLPWALRYAASEQQLLLSMD